MAIKESVQTAGITTSVDNFSNEVEATINRSNKIAKIVGSFFLTSNVTFILGAIVLIESILSAPDYLTLVSENRIQVILGVLLELINGIAYVGIAVLMFPIFKHRYESLALGYIGFRVIELMLQIASDICPLALLTLSEEFIRAGAPGSSAYQSLGTLLLAERFWSFQMLNLIFSLSAVVFYVMLYRLPLIPRFISIWGLIGAGLVLVNTVFDMAGLSLGMLGNLGILMLLNELFLGVWLIVKGFIPSALTFQFQK
jgi:hypothetical protein